MSIVVKHKI